MRRIDFTNTQVASSETARDINRGVVLNLIRRRQPISRADLARISGLQRSTVSLITEQLIREKWVVHGPIGRLPRGRRPTYLRLNDKRAILVVDLRPTYATICVADVNGNFLSQENIPTSATASETAQNLATRLRQLMQVHSDLVFEGVGISLPGRADPVTHRVVFAPNLKWSDFDLKTPIEKITGLRVEMENAANACVLAEIWFSRADTVRDLVVVAVAEGLGTGIFTNGQLVRGLHGMAGEFGHIPLEANGLECTCGGRGCWEVYASNRAALRYYHEDAATGDGPTFRDLLTLAEAGDAMAGKALDRMAQAIGRGIRMVVAAVAPEEIVLAGEFTRLWKRMGPVIESEITAGLLLGKPPRLRPAAVEPSMARLRGAVALVLQRHFGPSSKVAVGKNREARLGVARAQ